MDVGLCQTFYSTHPRTGWGTGACLRSTWPGQLLVAEGICSRGSAGASSCLSDLALVFEGVTPVPLLPLTVLFPGDEVSSAP